MIHIKSKNPKEFSKIIIAITGVVFILTLLEMPILPLLGVNTDDFATQQIITTGGLFGASVVAYLNKAKLENSIKIKKSIIEWQWDFKERHKLNQEQFQEIQQQSQPIDDAITTKVDDTIISAVNEDIQIPSI